jgi:hypothetical protein
MCTETRMNIYLFNLFFDSLNEAFDISDYTGSNIKMIDND